MEIQNVVKLPAEVDSLHWKTFQWIKFKREAKTATFFQQFIDHIPSLWNVFQGDLGFVGIAPRSAKELELLEMDWKIPVLKSKTGLITIDLTREEGYDCEEGRKIDEIYYTANHSPLFDLKIAYRWFLNGFKQWLRGKHCE